LNSPAGWLIGIPFYYFAYWFITLAEEDYLRRRFGAPYEDYCRRVNRFLPSPRGLAATMRSIQFDWRRVVRKEYGSTFTWITTLLALIVWERVAWRGWAESQRAFRVVVVLWGLDIIGYAIARFLKKTKRLESS
jgi:hypothetical protein